MGLVDRIERRLESTVGDAFARVFGGSIVPQEVEAALRREADIRAREVGGGRILAPNDYVITLSVPDYQKVSADPDLTSTTFAKHLEGFIHENGWQTYGDVVVRFEQSANLHTGQFRAHGAVNPDSTTGERAPEQRDRASTAEPGVPPMTDNPSYRGGQGQGRPGDEHYDERSGRQQDEPRSQEPPAAKSPAARTRRNKAVTRRRASPTTRPARATRTRAAIRIRAATPTRVTRRRTSNSARPPGTARPEAVDTSRAIARRPAGTARRRAASPATATTTTAGSLPVAKKKAMVAASPGRATRIRAATAAASTGVRSTRNPITGATASRQAAVTPSPDTPSPRAANTSTAQLRASRLVATAAGTATTRPAALPSRCNSTTAVVGPTSCAKAPT